MCAAIVDAFEDVLGGIDISRGPLFEQEKRKVFVGEAGDVAEFIAMLLSEERSKLLMPIVEAIPTKLAAESPDAEALDDNEIQILSELYDTAPALCTNYALEAATRISRKTIGKRLQRLRALDLVAHPRGERKGATLTKKGYDLVEGLRSRK